jgi:hypothetical protein
MRAGAGSGASGGLDPRGTGSEQKYRRASGGPVVSASRAAAAG